MWPQMRLYFYIVFVGSMLAWTWMSVLEKRDCTSLWQGISAFKVWTRSVWTVALATTSSLRNFLKHSYALWRSEKVLKFHGVAWICVWVFVHMVCGMYGKVRCMICLFTCVICVVYVICVCGVWSVILGVYVWLCDMWCVWYVCNV